MNLVVWILQGLLAAAFLAHGLFLLFPPAEVLAQMAWMPTAFRIFLGAAEALAGVGLTLPGITRIQPWWIHWAAAGLMVVMISATIFHVARGEVSGAIITAVLFLMAAFVAYMRKQVIPILPRRVV
jgi:putative oxidoreductase